MDMREEMIKSFIAKIADGNIGALICCIELLGTTEENRG